MERLLLSTPDSTVKIFAQTSAFSFQIYCVRRPDYSTAVQRATVSLPTGSLKQELYLR